jgi:hypothetical protein
VEEEEEAEESERARAELERRLGVRPMVGFFCLID